MRYQSMTIDRRQAYYTKAAEHIAKDPLGYQGRIQRGLMWLNLWFRPWCCTK